MMIPFFISKYNFYKTTLYQQMWETSARLKTISVCNNCGLIFENCCLDIFSPPAIFPLLFPLTFLTISDIKFLTYPILQFFQLRSLLFTFRLHRFFPLSPFFIPHPVQCLVAMSLPWCHTISLQFSFQLSYSISPNLHSFLSLLPIFSVFPW